MPATSRYIKRVLMEHFPDTTLRVLSARSRYKSEKLCQKIGLDEIARAILRHSNGSILGGPFAGMLMDYGALPVHSSPKFLGTYEKEIAPFVEDLVSSLPSTILNVGCSDGYYAVGLATRVPNAIIYAADADPKSQAATLSNARLNKVAHRVKPIGILHPGQFATYLPPEGGFVVMDCEGAELHLLDPERDPVLKSTGVLVEVHPEHGDPESLLLRFEPTHRIARADALLRTWCDAPVDIPGIDMVKAMDELRGQQFWLYCKPRDQGNGH